LRSILKYFVENTYKPLLVRYLSTTRKYDYKGISLMIPSEVFHPGFFFSTKLLLRYISFLDLKKHSFLELGAGSGLISIFAAKAGALVTATDINTVAIEYLKKNRQKNAVQFRIIHADLFDGMPTETFDIIAINPPYYKRNPQSEAEYAWCCGENGEFFDKLFSGLPLYMGPGTTVLLILCDGCDLEMIRHSAHRHWFRLDCVLKKQNLLEDNFIFKISNEHGFSVS